MAVTTPNERSVRLQRLRSYSAAGHPAYPAKSTRTHTCAVVNSKFEELVKNGTPVTLTGRLRSIRLHGGSTFADLEDFTGRIQLYAKRQTLNEQYNLFEKLFDVGDFIEAIGTAFRTRRGEPTLLLTQVRLLSKSLRPLPEKWHGLSDVELRYRKRALDLLANPYVRDVVITRSEIIHAIRTFFVDRGYVEVETPILQPVPGGANAEPFVTHHDALKIDLYLRIAPELYLKRLLVGGFERVFEIGRCFRNEGIDRLHNPEFTQVEAYEAYADYESYLELVEALLVAVLEKVGRSLVIESAGRKIDFTPPYSRITFFDALKKYAKVSVTDSLSDDDLRRVSKERGLTLYPKWGRGRILDEIFRELVRPQLIAPTFLIDHPIELSPLAKRKTDDPKLAERFQLLAGGMELVNAFSELNDPLDQRERFERQEALRRTGDLEAQQLDEDYLETLEYGMPPAAGLGLGIDRLVALLTNQPNLKEVILFPTLKPKGRGSAL